MAERKTYKDLVANEVPNEFPSEVIKEVQKIPEEINSEEIKRIYREQLNKSQGYTLKNV